MFISFLCMFRVTVWISTLHTRQSSIQNNKYQVSHKYSCFSWWWAHIRPKHVEKRSEHTKKNCAPSWLYLQDYTGMHGQQNIQFNSVFYIVLSTEPSVHNIQLYNTMNLVWLHYCEACFFGCYLNRVITNCHLQREMKYLM
jgi:hypothetical protein